MTHAPAHSRSGLLQTILQAGLAAGVLDILDAFVFYGWRGVGPVSILWSISSGVLGRAAYSGGATTALLGVVLHLLMTTLMAAFYAVCAQRLPVLRKHWLVCGLLYGVVLYVVMQHIVLPLSAVVPRPSFQLAPFLNGVIGHALLVGLPIAWLVARRRREPDVGSRTCPERSRRVRERV